jgi:hypothetical protein
VRNADWTPEMVVETAFKFVYSVFQKAKLRDEDHNGAVQQLIDKLRHEIALGDANQASVITANINTGRTL